MPEPLIHAPALGRRGALLGAAALLAAPPILARPATARSGPESFSPLVKRVMPTVVNIAVNRQTLRQSRKAGQHTTHTPLRHTGIRKDAAQEVR